jgi:Flp pilus assembly protein TadG
VTESARRRTLTGRSGQTLVEFSVVTVLTVLMLLFVVEMGRMVLVYTTVANAARAGVRYAIVHGSSRAVGTTVNSASGPLSNPPQVLTVISNFAGAGLLTTSRLVVNVTYPDSAVLPDVANAPGHNVKITVVYPYDPLTTYFSKTLRLGSAAQGIIVF